MTKNKFSVGRGRGTKPIWERGAKSKSEENGGRESNYRRGENEGFFKRGYGKQNEEDSRRGYGKQNAGFPQNSEEENRGFTKRAYGNEENPYGGYRESENGGYEDYEERAAYDEDRNSYIAEKLEFHAKTILSEENLPISFAKLLCGGDEQETLENIGAFKEEFRKAVEAALSEKLKGSTPRTASGTIDYDPFLRGFGY